MPSISISFHAGTNTSISHNNRLHLSGNPNIDSTRTHQNITYVKKDIRTLYAEEFGQAVAEYNTKQKRNDRKINDYYSKILHDKKTHHQRELIVAVGKSTDLDFTHHADRKKQILDHYMKHFQERNPNLKVYNAVMHLDEGNPHLHINYVPVFESKRGLKKRVGHDKALEQQGLKNFEEWRLRETYEIETYMKKEFYLNRRFEGSHKHLSVKEYKVLEEEIEELRELKNSLKDEVAEYTDNLEALKQEIPMKKTVLGDIKLKEADFESFHEMVKVAQAHHYQLNHFHSKTAELERREKKIALKEKELKERETQVTLRELEEPLQKIRSELISTQQDKAQLEKENQTLKQTVTEQSNELQQKNEFIKQLYSLSGTMINLLRLTLEKNPNLTMSYSFRSFISTFEEQTKGTMVKIRKFFTRENEFEASDQVSKFLSKKEIQSRIKQSYDKKIQLSVEADYYAEQKKKKTQKRDYGMER